MADKFEDLRTYVTVVTCGGVNAAAAELGIAKSAVSRRLSDLEARLGVALIERTKRSFEVTAVGREYFRRANEILNTLKQLDEHVGADGPARTVTVSAPAAVLIHLIAPALARLARQSDLKPIHLTERGSGATDIAITVGRGTPDGFAVREVGRFDKIVCAAPKYLEARGTPQLTADLASHHGIAIVGAGDTDWLLVGGAPRPPAIVLSVPDEETGLAAALAGIGLVQLQDFVAADAIRSARLVQVLKSSTPPDSGIWLTHADDAPTSVRSIADALTRDLRRP